MGMSIRMIGCLAFAGLLVSLASVGLAEDDNGAGYRRVTGPCRFVFPRDHGSHEGFRTEWWYYTGNLKTQSGARFGFQLTFFRHQLRPLADRRQWPEKASNWRTDQIFLAHAALTDITGRKHYFAEDLGRGAMGLAGAEHAADGVRVFLNNWETTIEPHRHRLVMQDDAFGFNLDLTPVKQLVAHGDQGYSRKGTAPSRASCYYSFTRLATSGTIFLQGKRLEVEGLSWMDHEFSTAPLEPGISGWYWFSLQLDNDTELMLFLLNLEGGGYHPASSATLVAADGRTTAVPYESIRADVLRNWTSPETGTKYPLGWRLQLSKTGLDLKIQTPVDNQEMITTHSTGVTYWEGSVAVEGRYGAKQVKGRGYMELTGQSQGMDGKL
jgi:predicted secreted hydrolase